MTTLSSSQPRIAAAEGHYLYAIIDGIADLQPLGLVGMDGADVYAVCDDGIAAVVSDLSQRKLRPERRRLAAHHEVLKRLMAEHTVLPMAFGLVADNADAVRSILRLNRRDFTEQLERVRGKIELGLRVVWDTGNVFELLLAAHPDLRAMRDYMFRGGRQPSHEEKIELGRQFDRSLAADREECVDRAMAVLENYCAEIIVNPPRNEKEVMNLACLIDREQVERFEHGVVEAAGRFDDRFVFDFNGPWPPHNFVKLELRTS